MILYMILFFFRENYVKFIVDILFNLCLCVYCLFIIYKLFYEIIEMEVFFRLMVIVREFKVRGLCLGLIMVFCVRVGKFFDFSN